jgi:4-amino-4-deoxychorismate lyase
MRLVNGSPDGAIDPLDRGLHYGDGLFETFAVRDGGPMLWDRHLARLSAGCARLGLASPPPGLLAEEAARLCAGCGRGVLKLVVTRGPGRRGYRPGRAGRETTRLLMVSPADAYPPDCYRDGVAVRVCATPLGLNPALGGLKHLNRLEQVLARDEWDDPEIAEGLMLDARGDVVEGTMSNLFAVSEGRLCTPPLAEAGVAGVMRGFLMERAAALGAPAAEVRFSPDWLSRAQEVFLCNSLIGVWPVRRIADTAFAVGALTRRLMAEAAPHSLMP